MEQFAIRCGCGRTMRLDGRAGRSAYRCGCGMRVEIAELDTGSRRCTFVGCRTVAVTKDPLRFCLVHEEEAANLLAHTAGVSKVRELQEGLQSSSSTLNRRYGLAMTPVPRNTKHAPLVYFARRERLIKIGWTANLPRRMQVLCTSPLAIEPGDVVRERQLHLRFAHLRMHKQEWFRPGPDLIAYVNQLRKAEGAPPIHR